MVAGRAGFLQQRPLGAREHLERSAFDGSPACDVADHVRGRNGTASDDDDILSNWRVNQNTVVLALVIKDGRALDDDLGVVLNG